MKFAKIGTTLILLMALTLSASAARYHVTTNGTDGANDGLTWGAAYKTISNALAKAVTPGDEVMVSNGTYVLSATLVVNNAITLTSTNGAVATIVSGGGAVRCMLVSNASARVTGLTITRGGNNTLGQGGGVYLFNGLVADCIVTNNNGGASGGNSGGGGIYLVNGVVSNCDIAYNTCYYGGGLRIVGSGLLTHSRIFNNTCDVNGSAVTLSSGTMRNCLVYRNYAIGSVAVQMTSGVIQNSTITENLVPGNAARTVCAVSGGTGCTLVNTIIRDNIYTLYSPTNFGGAVSATNCCLEFPWPGNGNMATNPLFLKPTAADYRLAADSPCLNAGTNQAWMTAASDVAGVARIGGDRADIGAYEMAPSLVCGIQADPPAGLAPLSVTLAALFSGADTNGLYYRWSYTNSAVVDEEGADKRTVSHVYDAGLYTITLSVSNGAGSVAGRDYQLKVSSPTVYVARAGSNASQYPYASWGAAASNIQDAVNAAVPGAVVLLSNGTWSTSADIVLTNAITVTSLNGATSTFINCSTRAFFVDHPGAVVERMTLRHAGQNSLVGNVVYLRFGTVRNCVVTGGYLNSGGSTQGGAGAFILYGMISNCSVYANLNTSSGGAGIRVGTGSSGAAVGYTPLITHCILRNNTNNVTTTYAFGGGAHLDAGVIRNCLVFGNSSSMGGSGVILNNAGTTMQNCTLSGNTCPGNNSPAHPGALSPQNGTIVNNSISRGNTYTVVAPTNFGSATTPIVNYCDLEFEWAGTGNQTNDPLFLDPAATNYTLAAASLGIDAGSNQAWMAGAVDLAGNGRTNGGTVDLGAYEFNLGPLTAAIGASPDRGLAPLQVALSATVSGQNTNGLYYWWSFTNSAVVDAEGADKKTVTNVFLPGYPVVTLTVSNSIGEVVQDTQNLKISAPTCYVARLGWNTATFPYSDWATAASNLPEAVLASQAGGVVIVTNGTYPLPSQVTVTEAIQIRSVNGAAATVVDGGLARRCFLLQSPGALLQGITIIRGTGDQGAGVYLEYGTVADCVVTGCVGTSGGSTAGGVLYVVYGTATNCYLARNTGYENGGAVRLYQSAGLVTHCTIVSNRLSSTTTGAGGGALVDFGRIRNCLVFGNYSAVAGSGVSLGGSAIMENCTVVSNTSPGIAGPAVGTAAGSRVLNSVIWGNIYTNVVPSSFAGPPAITYTRTEFAWAGDGNTTADPIFVNSSAGDFTLRGASPCVNTGSNVAWMAEAVDLAGNRRIIGPAADMGAYECRRVAGTVIWVR